MKRQHLLKKMVLLAPLFLVIQVIGILQVHAQTTGTIYGTITDPAGAAIAGATVTATNQSTNLKRTTTTGAEGTYKLTLLPVGSYLLTVEAQNFKAVRAENIKLEVEANLREDMKLEVGAITEEVLVAGGTPQVDTASTTLGKVVDQRRIVDLPLNGRNFLQLAVLQAGVTPPIAGIDVVGSGLNQSPGGTSVLFSVNGMRIISNNHLLDGINNVEPFSGAAMVVPSPDVIQEFRILTNLYSAEFGRAGGAIVTVLTKAGTNNLHGSVYEFLRNDVLDARNFFAPDVPALKQNQFGFSVGGPIVKDRMFFFGGYEGFRQRKGNPTSAVVPSLRVRQGDFSQEPIKPIDPVTRQRFPGDIIPANRIDSVARNVMNLYPAPNLGTNIWTGAPSGSNDRDQFTARVDYSFLDGKNTLVGRYTFDEGSQTRPNGAQTSTGARVGVLGFPFADENRFQNFMLADTHLISPNVINEVRFSYQRANVQNGIPLEPLIDRTALGFTFPVPGALVVAPQIEVLGISSLGYTLFNTRVSDFVQLLDNVVMTRGNHTFKFGGDLRYTSIFGRFPSLNFGSYNFTGQLTTNSVADLLLGVPFTFSQVAGLEDKKIKQTTFSLFAQDDYRVTRNLTLNLGLRYEYVPGYTERDDLLVTFVPGQRSTVAPTLPLGLLRPGDPGIPDTLFPTKKTQFAPRIGIAWDPFGDGKTSVRAGYGIFYDESALVQNSTVQQPPDYQPFSVVVLAQSFADPFLGNSPFRPPLQFPLPLSPGSTVGLFASDFKMGMVQHWNLTLQRQLTSSLAVELAYVGNKGSNLQGDVDPNQAFFVPGSTVQNAPTRRPYNPIGRMFQIASVFNSSYHGLQATATQRFSRGLSFQASYTWSKAIDESSKPTSFFRMPGQVNRIQDSRNIRGERGLSTFHLSHRFVLSSIYEFPFFKKSNALVSSVLGGWKLSGILSLQTGIPFTVQESLDTNLDAERNNDRPDVVRNPNLPDGQRRPERWFDTGAFQRYTASFSRPALNFGTAGRSILLADGLSNLDMGLAKDFRTGEWGQLEFRWEVFNLFNHTNFGIPQSTFGVASFGQVLNTQSPERVMQFALKFLF